VQVQNELNNLYAQVDLAVEAYDKATSRLHDVRHRMRVNAAHLHQAESNLAAARIQLARLMVSAYKGGTPNVAAYVLGAGSFNDLVDRLDLAQRSSRQQSQVLAQIAAAEHSIKINRAALRVEERKARKLVKQADARRRHVNALIVHQRTVLSGIKANIATLIKQQQERQARLARERAAAAARAAAEAAAQQAAQQQQPTPAPTGGGTSSGGSPPPPTPSPPPAGSLGQQAVAIAEGELGVPYVWGGASPSGFDCSGLTMWVYAQLGVSLPHFAAAQFNAGPHVSRDQLEPGDLVFFEPGIGHVGIYIGNGEFIDAPHTGAVVSIESMSNPWYVAEYQGAVRIVG
jgi:cell wall-associated NlpC family hydrolase